MVHHVVSHPLSGLSWALQLVAVSRGDRGGEFPKRQSPWIDSSSTHGARGEDAGLGGVRAAKLIEQPFQDVCVLWPVRLAAHRDPRITYHLLYRGKTRTFKPRKDIPEGTKQYQLRKYAEATLVRWLCPISVCVLVEL